MNKYKLYTDGSHVVYQNVAGFGGYILNSAGEQITSFHELIEEQKYHAKHELVGFIYGLEQALSLGIKEIDCFSDSLSLVKILNATNQELIERYVKKEPLIAKAMDLMDSFDNISFTHIKRNENKLADKLARKAVLSENIKTTQIPESSYSLPNLHSSNQYLKTNKKEFNKLKEGVEDYLIFKNKFYKNKQYLEVYKAKENWETKEVEYSRIIYELLPTSKWPKKVFSIMIDLLNEYEGKKLNIAISGGFLKQIDFILRGIVPISKSKKSGLKDLTEAIQKMDMLIVHGNTNVINKIMPKKNVEILDFNKENLITALKVIGDENYEIGDNLSIECMIEIPDGKKKNIIEIQKKFFGEFMKLSLSLDEKFHKSTFSIKDRIEETREELIKSGVNFRY